ncbi:MAG: tetratricopeptide repeat protein [Planctomycetes bacterium]|nr:tetratricopeptide repeat protein [Planctomycetota bacterium]
MRSRRAKSVPPAAPVARAPRAGFWTRRRAVYAALVLLVGAAAWGAWERWKPDPLREARAALDRREFQTAVNLLAARLEKNPTDKAAALLLAQTARRANDFNRARLLHAEYEQRFGSTPELEREVRLLRAQTGSGPELARVFAEVVAKPGAPDAALAAEAFIEGKFRVVAPLGAGRADPATEEAALAAVEAAAPDLTRAVDLWLGARPGTADQVQGRLWRARLDFALNKHPSGVAALREALARDPDHYEARYQLAQAVAQSDPDAAIAHFEQLLQARPTDTAVRFALATACRSVGRAADARRLLDAMLTRDPNDLSALIELSHLELDAGNPTAAEVLLKKAHARVPNIGETNLALARCMQLAGKPAEAAKYRARFDEIEAALRTPPKK